MSFFPLIKSSSKEDIKGDGIARPDLHVVTVLLTSKRIVLIMIRSRVPVQVYSVAAAGGPAAEFWLANRWEGEELRKGRLWLNEIGFEHYSFTHEHGSSITSTAEGYSLVVPLRWFIADQP